MDAPQNNEEAAPALGAEIRRLRQLRGWTLRELAQAVDLDFGFVGKVERGENATMETYRALARALGTTLSALTAVLDARKGRRTAPRRSAARAVST